MDADPPSDKCEKALKQLTAPILTVCSDRLQNTCEVDVSAEGCTSTDVGDLIQEVADLIHAGDCNQAASCARAVNGAMPWSTTEAAAPPSRSARKARNASSGGGATVRAEEERPVGR